MIEIKENRTLLNVDIASSCNVSTNIEEKKKIDVVIGDAAKMDVQKAVNYIESGKAELTPLTVRAENAAQSAAESAAAALSAAESIISDKAFVFEQGIASNMWVIEHNLNKYPSVSVVDSANNIITPEVEYIDLNNIVVRMNGATTGKAFLN